MVSSICALDNEMLKIKDSDDVVIILFEEIEELYFSIYSGTMKNDSIQRVKTNDP